MPQIRWMKPSGRRILADTTVHTGSALKASARFYEATLPESFGLWRGYNRVGSWMLRKRNKPTLTLIDDDIDATPTSASSVETEEFVVPTFGLRVHVPLILRDELGNVSPRLYASGLGGLEIGPNIQVLGNGGGLGSADFKAAVDPSVKIRALFPWYRGEDGLESYIEEVAADVAPQADANPGELMREFVSAFEWAMPSDPLPDWQIKLSLDHFHADEGSHVPFEFHVDAPTPGITAFAIEVTVSESQEEELARGSAVSELFMLEAHEDGEVELTQL